MSTTRGEGSRKANATPPRRPIRVLPLHLSPLAGTSPSHTPGA